MLTLLKIGFSLKTKAEKSVVFWKLSFHLFIKRKCKCSFCPRASMTHHIPQFVFSTVDSKIIRALEIVRVKKLTPNAVL